jgi:hypothetical protein
MSRTAGRSRAGSEGVQAGALLQLSDEERKRHVVRNAALRLLRLSAVVDPYSLDDAQLEVLAGRALSEALAVELPTPSGSAVNLPGRASRSGRGTARFPRMGEPHFYDSPVVELGGSNHPARVFPRPGQSVAHQVRVDSSSDHSWPWATAGDRCFRYFSCPSARFRQTCSATIGLAHRGRSASGRRQARAPPGRRVRTRFVPGRFWEGRFWEGGPFMMPA